MDNCASISLKGVLSELCRETPWKYAIYWKLERGPRQILAWEDDYVDTTKLQNGLIDCKDGNSVDICYIEQIFADMSHRQFSVEEGIIGEVALIGQHKWIFPEKYEPDMLYKLPEDWQRQFLAGIKTILLVPIGNFGVLQLGSLHIVYEDHNLVAKIKDLLTSIYQYSAKYALSGDFFEEMNLSKCLPINPYNPPYCAHAFDFPVVDNMHLQNFNQNASTDSAWDSLPFSPEFGAHGIGLGCFEENSSLLLETPAPEGYLFESSCGEICTDLTKGTGTEHLLEDIITSNVYDSSEVTDYAVSYFAKSLIEGFAASSVPLPSGDCFVSVDDCLSAKKKNNKSGVVGQIETQKRRKVRQDVGTRRPRDRELIQDRINELRELIPDGSKCSIDAALERTVKHMVFLESVSQRAKKLKQTESSRSETERGGNKQQGQGQLVVEDLDQPGNYMLIEMVCMEYDVFLEMAKIIKGLRLPILNGGLDNRSGQLWAHFVIEVSRGFERTHIVWPLMQLLQASSKPPPNPFSH